MRIIIDTIAELDELAEVWARGRLQQRNDFSGEELTLKMDGGAIRKAIDETLAELRGKDIRPVTAEGAVIPPEPQDAQQPASADAGEAPSTEAVPQAPQRRKRRTKAEIAADEAAAKAAQVPDAGAIIDKGDGTAVFADGEIGRSGPEPNGLTPNAEIVALAATIDGNDRKAHMDEGRDFIAKHGFPKYNETFALADVPQHIATHTPEQAALHRAAMQWLATQGGAA